MSRLKRVLIVLGSIAAVLISAIGSGFLWLRSGAKASTVGSAEFPRELGIPPLAPSTGRSDATRVFDLTTRAGRKEFRPGKPRGEGAAGREGPYATPARGALTCRV